MTSELSAALNGSKANTPQQEAIHASMLAGESSIITARAGTGKTYTLRTGAEKVVAANPAVRGAYLVFNVKNKKEAEKEFPPQFQCITMNGLGHRAWSYGRRLRLPGRDEESKALQMVKQYLEKNKLTATFEERVALVNLLNAARTLCLVPSEGPPGVGFTEDSVDGWQQVVAWAEVDMDTAKVQELVIMAKAILALSIQTGFAGFIDYADQIYLPTCFGGTWPSFDIVLGDEVQDWSPANHKMVRLTRAPQKVLVGDPKQAIYAFRGAMSDSMDHLENCMPKGTEWKHLSLTKTFRCGKKIVERQKSFCPDFEAADTNCEGQVVNWPGKCQCEASHCSRAQCSCEWPTENWSPKAVPDGSAILSRNNAQLITCALRFIAAKRRVTVLGRDFADRLKKDISKATKGAPGGMPIEQVLEKVKVFYEAKLEGKKPTEQQLEEIQDRVAAVAALSEGCNYLSDLSDAISRIFSDSVAPVTLATGHKAKGLEWDFVVHLDPWRIPSKWAKEKPEALQQELNLRYVIETRARKTLVLANLEDLET